uniref:Nephrocystin 3-like N-terminal domain-containing protein n=1 Tax=Bionectria ochroleuca TaxID=29856 RepID=A0A8H7TW05_BIOOC
MEEIVSPTGQAPIASFALNVIVNPENPRLDIVFVHGFNGHPERTWTDKSAEATSRNEPRSDEHQGRPSKFRKLKPGSKPISAISQDGPVCWPRDLVPKVVPDARVLSYGYDAKIQRLFGPPVSTHTVYDISNDFSIALEAERQDEPQRPIIFIAHSLGGIIVKDLLRRCGQSFNQNHLHIRPIFESTIGIIFFGTPHSGADPGGSLLHFGERVLKALGHSVNENVRASLLPTSDRLRELRDVFGLMARKRRWKIHSFQEQYGFKALGGQKVVEDTSSYVNIPDLEIVEHINQDHSKMCRFSGVDDPEFKKVGAALRRMLPDIPEKEIEPQVSAFARPSLTEEQKAAILESLKFDQIDARVLTIEKAHSKTCRWLLLTQEYRDWTNPEKVFAHQGFLWMKGNPGTGKSTLMKFAYIEAKKNRKKNRFIFSFFFNARGAPLERSTTGMYRSLLVQILEQFPNQKCIFDSPELGTRIGPRQTWAIEPLKELLLQALLKLAGVSIVFFIDALDECDEDEIRDMIKFFENIGQEHPSINLSIFFSSRHYPHITINFGLSLCLEEQDGHSNGISNYIQSELRIGKSSMAKGIREEVQNKACGVFMWVVLVVAILNKEYDNGNMHTLRRRLKDLPSDLYKLFEDIILRDDRNRDSLLLCVQWVLFAKTPLSPEQLYFAIRHGLEFSSPEPWDQDEITRDTIKRFLLHSSKGLAEVTKSKQPTVQFIHESVREFFLKNTGLAKIWPEIGPRFEANGHERLKQLCLSYSNPELKFFYSFGQNPTMPVAELDLLFPLLKYCVKNIIHHADMAENGGVDQLTFISCFDRSGWIMKNNIYETHQIRRYTLMASLLYILAEADASNLIQRYFSSETSTTTSCLEVEDERYGCPFFASIATKSFGACNKFYDLMAPSQLGKTLALSEEPASPHHKSPNFALARTFKFSQKKTLLKQAAEAGNEDLLSFLLRLGLKAVDFDFTPLLHLSAQKGHAEVLKVMLETSNGNPESKDANGRTPLMSAALGGHVHAVQTLLGIAKVDPNMTDSAGRTAISCAVLEEESEVIELLLKVDKLDPNIADMNGRTPLLLAARLSNPEVIKALLAVDKVDPNLADKTGRTPLSWAAQSWRSDITYEVLAARKVDPNLVDENGETPLHWAVKTDRETIVGFLLMSPKVNPNIADKHSETPLSWAIKNGRQRITSLLLKSPKVDPNFTYHTA